MILPEVIDKIRREKEDRERAESAIPLYLPDDICPDWTVENEDPAESPRVVVIEMV